MTSQKIKTTANRKDRLEYRGVFTDFQTFGSSYKGERYSNKPTYEQDPYSQQQNFLYKRAMFGLKMYSKEEVRKMSSKKRKRIIMFHKRTQKELNLWKQEIIIKTTNTLFSLFKKESLAGEMTECYSKPDKTFVSRTSFKDLGIEKEDIVNRLLDKRLLPQNFREL